MTKKIKVTQIKSVIGTLEAQKRTIHALGLRKISSSVVHDDTPVVSEVWLILLNILSKSKMVDGE